MQEGSIPEEDKRVGLRVASDLYDAEGTVRWYGGVVTKMAKKWPRVKFDSGVSTSATWLRLRSLN